MSNIEHTYKEVKSSSTFLTIIRTVYFICKTGSPPINSNSTEVNSISPILYIDRPKLCLWNSGMTYSTIVTLENAMYNLREILA